MTKSCKSCFNCKHLKTWDYPATREDPGDSGFECVEELEDLDLCDTSTQSDEECARIYAQDCPGYEFHDWEADALAQEIEASRLPAATVYDRAADLYDWESN